MIVLARCQGCKACDEYYVVHAPKVLEPGDLPSCRVCRHMHCPRSHPFGEVRFFKSHREAGDACRNVDCGKPRWMHDA